MVPKHLTVEFDCNLAPIIIYQMEQKLVNHFMAEKAGMSAVDKTEVNKKVEAMTKGTHKQAFEKELDEKRSA